MNSQQTYTTHMTQYFIIPNLILPPNTPFSQLGFDCSTECSWCHKVIRRCKNSCLATVLSTTGRNWNGVGVIESRPVLGPKAPTLFQPKKPEHTLPRTFLPRVSPNDRNKTHVQNTWVHKYKSIRWWTKPK